MGSSASVVRETVSSSNQSKSLSSKQSESPSSKQSESPSSKQSESLSSKQSESLSSSHSESPSSSNQPDSPPKYTKHDTAEVDPLANTKAHYTPCTRYPRTRYPIAGRPDLDALQRECVSVDTAEVVHGSTAIVDPRRIKRLRIFLSYALKVDYVPWERATVSEFHAAEFLNVASYMTTLRRITDGYQHAPTNPESHCQFMTDEISRTVAEPAREMGIPVHIALAAIVRYAANLDGSGRYHGCIDPLEKAGRYRELCDKLFMDAYVVIPAVFEWTENRFRVMNIAEAEWNRCKKNYGPHIETTEGGGCVYNHQSSMRGGPLDPDEYGIGQAQEPIRLRMLTVLSAQNQSSYLTSQAAVQRYLQEHAKRQGSASEKCASGAVQEPTNVQVMSAQEQSLNSFRTAVQKYLQQHAESQEIERRASGDGDVFEVLSRSLRANPW